MIMFKTDIKEELISALKSDRKINFKEVGNEFRDGICPKCGEKELYVSMTQPFRVQCRRANNCDYSESTRVLYPEIFENLSKKHPATDLNPHATADAYLSINRHFRLETIKGMYEQSWKKLKNGTFAATIRFPLWDNHYWERIIDADKVAENEGKKAHISYGTSYAGLAWIPKGMEFNQNDIIYITEGIFKSISFLQIGKKSISALSCSNVPLDIIKEHSGKNITWVLAGDNDHAGITSTAKHLEKVKTLGEKCLVAFPEHENVDWDDEYRNGKLTDKYLEECIWRGYFFLADSPKMKAFFLWGKNLQSHNIFDFHNSLYSYLIEDGSTTEDIKKDKGCYTKKWSEHTYSEETQKFFDSIAKIQRISNCFPLFLYEQENTERKIRSYVIEIKSAHGNKTRITDLSNKAMLAPKDFSAELLKAGSGFVFDGDYLDLKFIRDSWLNRKLNCLEVVDFIGYSKEYKTYIYPDFGFKNGNLLTRVNNDYIAWNDFKTKTTLQNIPILYNKSFNAESWIEEFKQVFHYNGIALLSWWLGSLFAEQVKEKQASYPWFELTGEPSTGKTTLIKFLWKLTGRSNFEGFDPCKDNPKARDRHMKQVGNLPVVFVEGDRKDAKYSLDLNEYKNCYDFNGMLRSTAKADYTNETNTFPFRGTLLIAQNAQIESDPAVLERICYFHCTKEHHFEGSAEIVEKFKEEISTQDVCGFLSKALKNEPMLMNNYLEKYKEIRVWMKNKGLKHSRLVHNYSQIAAWTWQLPFMFNDKISQAECQAIQTHLLEKGIERASRIQGDHPMIQQFWEYYDDINYEYCSSSIPGENYEINRVKEVLNHSIEKNLIAINLTHFETVISLRHLQRLPFDQLKKILPYSKRYKFIENKVIKSALENISKRCWIFRKE